MISFSIQKQLKDDTLLREQYSLQRFEPSSTYEQRDYPRTLQEKFGFFRTTTYRFDPYGRLIDSLKKDYMNNALKKIVMLSDDLKNYTQWNGKGTIPVDDKHIIDSFIEKAHRLKKKIRFWDSPDFINAWSQLIDMGVDYINTDHIRELSAFLKQH